MAKPSALDVAKFFIDLANEDDENDLTNLKLQKLLYFAQGEHLVAYGTRLFDDPIEAWPYGPVIQTVYDTFKECGAYPISCFEVEYTANKVSNDVAEFLLKIWEKWGKFSAPYLVELTHKDNSPWKKAITSGIKTEISISDLQEYLAKIQEQKV